MLIARKVNYNMKLKVLIIGPNSSMKGGITTVISGYKSNGYYNDNFEVKHYSSCIDGPFIFKLLYTIIKLFFFPFFIIFYRPKIAHIHAAYGTSFLRKSFYIKLCKFFSIKVVIHNHGAEWENFYEKKSLSQKEKIKSTYNLCEYIIVLSEEWKERYIQFLDDTKVIVINNFTSIAPADVKKESHLKTNILFIGEFCERKGTYNIPEIISLMKNKGNVAVNIVGYGDTKRLRDSITKFDLDKCISIIGFADYTKKIHLLANSDIFLFPSYNEGVPMVLLEAMTFGIPCVTTDVGGIKSIINYNFDNGILFNPDDLLLMAKEIDKLIDDKDYYDRISSNCKVVANNFSIDNHMLQVVKLYNKLVKEEV